MSPVQLRRWWSGSYETDFQCISAVPGEPRGNPWEHLAVLSANRNFQGGGGCPQQGEHYNHCPLPNDHFLT